MDILNRLTRHLRSMYYRTLFAVNGFKYYPYGGGEEADGEGKGDEGGEGSGDEDKGGEGEKPWHSVLGEDAGKDPEITRYENAGEFYKAHQEKVSMISKKGIIVPDANAAPEVKDKFLNALGRPEKPEGYKLDPVEGIHESIKVTPETTQRFNGEMHKMGLTNEQANSINAMQMNYLNDAVKAQEQAEKTASEAAETSLRAEWKDKYDANKNAVVALMTKAGGQEAIDAMGGVEGLGNNPVVLKALGVISGMLSEDQINKIQGPKGPQGGNETQEEAKAKLSEFMKPGSDDHKALIDENDLRHGEVVSNRDRLYKIAYPGGS